jgi:hypothetical protein
MNNRAWMILLVAPVAACGAAESEVEDVPQAEVVGEALCQTSLSREQERVALKAIDDICADTWCAGDYNFHFERLTCALRAGACTLSFQIIPREGVPTTKPAYKRVCTTDYFTGYDSLVLSGSNGYSSLNWNYYLALTECITATQAGLPRPS